MSEEKDAKIQELEAEIARLKDENSKLQETVQWMHDLIWKMVREREGQKGCMPFPSQSAPRGCAGLHSQTASRRSYGCRI